MLILLGVQILPMRDWNPVRDWNCVTPTPFRSYLWGIETTQKYLFKLHCNPFRSYLWGIETWLLQLVQMVSECVQILPMRDWNYYELNKIITDYYVQILPMRDWNQVYQNLLHFRLFVQILPMRDWNILNLLPLCFYHYVQILPMRDWNNGEYIPFHEAEKSSDLTYEGLKLQVQNQGTAIETRFRSYLWGIETPSWANQSTLQICSDLTYEGLKLHHFRPPIWSHIRSDLTYEGLKRFCRMFSPSIPQMKFRSYLWGIETCKQRFAFISSETRFRSYLWGIETLILVLPFLLLKMFRSYLWGIETILI